VFDASGDEVPWEGVVATLTAERDALRAERITQALTADRFAAAVMEADTLQARVAELEAAAKLAQEANDDGGSNHAAQAASGGGVIRDMTDILRSNTADADEKHAALSTLVEAVCPGWALTQAASGGGGPVAWMLEWTDHADLYGSKTQAERAAAGDVVPQPLYRAPPQPRGWLTEDEREIIAEIADDDEYTEEGQKIAKGLLARSSPPEVVLPEMVIAYDDMDALKEALAAAGVTVKEVGRE
jgi:hypothetical protein